MPPFVRTLLLPLLLGAAAPQQSTPADQEIVVTAQNPQTVHDFVSAVTEKGPTGQLGRWDQFCPGVTGVGEAQAARIVERLKDIARSIQVDTGGAHCRPSTLILFDNDAAGLASAFAHRFPVTLRTDGGARLHLFERTRLPVRWLTVTDPCGKGCGVPNSIISLGTNPTFLAMIVIVDGTKIHGYGIDEVSDYLAAVALGNPPMRTGRPRDSVLSMFEAPRPAGRSFALTDSDRSLLAGLYASPTNLAAKAQRSAIAAHMRRERNKQR